MTLEQQVHDLEMRLREAERTITQLKIDSHPPVDIADICLKVLKEQQVVPQTSTTRLSRV